MKMRPEDTLHIEQMAKDCERLGRICIFISCQSNQFLDRAPSFGLESSITYNEAYEIVRILSTNNSQTAFCLHGWDRQ